MCVPDDPSADSPRPADRRAQGKARTHRNIVGAAGLSFAEHGFGETSVGAIARRANVAIGSVYAHFPGGKAALFLAALEQLLDDNFHHAEQALDERGLSGGTEAGTLGSMFADAATSRTRMILDLEAWLYTLRHDDDLARQLRTRHQAIHERAVGLVTANREPITSEGPAFDDGDIATITVALAHGLILESWLRPGDVDDDLLVRLLGVLKGVAAPPSTR